MANKKSILKFEREEEDTPFGEDLLERIPIGLRYMVKTETSGIGELYRSAKFSKSGLHQTSQYMNMNCYKPLSNLLIDPRTLQNESDE